MVVTIVRADQSAIKDSIKRSIRVLGGKCNLNFIDTELINDMRYMFYDFEFNGDISNWNVENVTNMKYMFCGSKFNGGISGWDVRNVTDMFSMFYGSKFNGNISSWNVEKVTNMGFMFHGCPLKNKPEFQPKFKKEIL